ncbi:bifunctional tetrahydrofolate synthase/dihydrofolate synthase [Alkalilimnicola ehrlichii]|uniref:Dihydrofolate synthase/folylpolyglutamate synthase n=1 Tax=Alkalilimnicola ehrlichii TaxID=351052 RepID=A0A3E0X1Z2_9GAMM|nr:bifunctional tetrahydrofolate synthase/dihydrofolate synthase [Alkalilimnicola ehrlichii]RFA30889.1 bifunctional tetrahydrofolate synthase/dihydrofolate synthase [Alkalilimnicola ehrlichii]RFA38839.1 bifunctional tetrahydrofolate synthase/dihydrofolate synthase [Alkalilimnicola ehrlichii]
MRFSQLNDWLEWQQSLHSRAIDLGLDRVRAVAAELDLLAPSCPVITVAGTNGKGSSVAFLEAILTAAGYRVGCYTSPHLFRYNERIRVAGQAVEDECIVQAFDRIDRARGETTLSYFEFGTLAAFDVFTQCACDVWILEVGLGGRLDAVNIVDADGVIISSIGLDHTDWLGPDRDSIGLEKVGVARRGRPVVFGRPDIPQSIVAYTAANGIPLYRVEQDYRYRQVEAGYWAYQGHLWHWDALPPPALSGNHQYGNAAAVLAVLERLQSLLPLRQEDAVSGIRQASLLGRCQRVPGKVEWVYDVAHNRESVAELAAFLRSHPVAGRTLAVFAQMQRKELPAVIAPLEGLVDTWLPLSLADPDARPADEVASYLRQRFGSSCVSAARQSGELLSVIENVAERGDRVVVFGSFRTVEELLQVRSD